MASAFGHAVVAITASSLVRKPKQRFKLYILSIISSIIPDADVIAFYFGIPYGHMFGHRGISHSIFFAVVWALLLLLIFYPKKVYQYSIRKSVFVLIFISTLSHGILDAMTTGGKGIAFFAPFTDERYFLPWRGIRVSPIGISNFFSDYGKMVLMSEGLYILVPCLVVVVVYYIFRKGVSHRRREGRENNF